jgi:hypothetical protein
MRALGPALVLLAGAAHASPLETYPPAGWQESRELEMSAPVPTRAYAAPVGDGVYAVTGTDDADGSLSEAAKRVADRLEHWLGRGARNGQMQLSKADGQYVVDNVVPAGDGRRVHIKSIAALEGVPAHVELRAAVCAAREPEQIAACDAAIAMLSLPVDSRYAPHSYTNVYWIGGAVGGGLFALAFGVLWLRRARRARDLAHSSPLADGELVTITGTVRELDATLSAALSGKRCVVYRSHARVYSRDPVPRLLAEPFELETVAFAVETPRGVVRVDERAPAVAMTAEAVVDEGQPRFGEFLAKHRVADQLRAGASFDEIVVETGQTVTLRGMIRLVRDEASTDERGYRDDAPTRPALVAAGDEPVTLLRMW